MNRNKRFGCNCWGFSIRMGKQIRILSALYQAHLNNDSVRKYYSWVFAPVELDSSAAKEQRENYERLMASRKKRENRLKENLLIPPPKELVLERLDKFEEGRHGFWRISNMELSLKPDSRYIDEWQFDLRLLPGWKKPTHKRVSGLSRRRNSMSNRAKSCKMINGWATIRFSCPAFAGYRALYLLLNETPEFVENLSEGTCN